MAKQQPSLNELFAMSPEQEARIDALVAKRAQRVAKADEGDADSAGDAAPLDERAQAALKAVARILTPFADQLTEDDMAEMMAEVGIIDGDDEDGDDGDAEDVDATDVGVTPADNTTLLVQRSAADNTQKDDSMADNAKPWEKDDMKKADAPSLPAQAEGVSDADYRAATKAALDAFKAAVSDNSTATEKAADDDDKDEDKDKAEKSVAKSAGVSAAYAAVIAKSASLEARIREMEDEREMKGYAEQLRAFSNLSIDVAKTARTLKTLAAHDRSAHDDYLAQLRSSNEQLRINKSSPGGLYGSSQSHHGQQTQASGNGSAEQELETMVNNYVAKSGSSDKGAAWAAVLKTPEGLAAYEKSALERKGGV